MKLLKERYRECSICAIFFNSSLTVSIKARFLQDFVRYAHQGVPHIVFNFSDKLDTTREKILKQSPANISLCLHIVFL